VYGYLCMLTRIRSSVDVAVLASCIAQACPPHWLRLVVFQLFSRCFCGRVALHTSRTAHINSPCLLTKAPLHMGALCCCCFTRLVGRQGESCYQQDGKPDNSCAVVMMDFSMEYVSGWCSALSSGMPSWLLYIPAEAASYGPALADCLDLP
jgi:hypothetical protein